MTTHTIYFDCENCKAHLRGEFSSNNGVYCPYCSQLYILNAPSNPNEAADWIGKLLRGVFYTALAAGGTYVVYKGIQALTDEDFGDGEFPQRVRHELRDEHVAQHGCYCHGCERKVEFLDLTVDHIVALKNGGRTSRANAQVICRSCNSSKGAKNSLLDYVIGRSA